MNQIDLLETKKNLKKHLSDCENLLCLLENNSLTEDNKQLLDNISNFFQKQHSQVLLNNEEISRFIDLIDGIPSVAVQGYNRKREVTFWNKASENIYGYTAAEAFGEKLEDLILPKEMHEDVKKAIHDWFENGTTIPSQELLLHRKNKSSAHVHSSHVMLGEDSASPELFCIDVDLSEVNGLRVENHSLETKVHFDQLTKIHNRYYFESIIDKKMQYAKHHNVKLSLIMFDLDFFKKINDEYGHSIGDKSLVLLTEITRRILEHDDIFVRWGGEEFMLLVEKNISDAIKTANIIRKSIELETSHSNSIPFFTCSFGVVDMSRHQSFQEAYEDIDKQLYLAKNNGRNRVEPSLKVNLKNLSSSETSA